MLIITNITLFENIYNGAKKVYPELKDKTIILDYTTETEIKLSEGTAENKDEYKIAITMREESETIAENFIFGLSMIVYKIKYDTFIDINSVDKTSEMYSNFKEILINITKEFQHVEYKGEYACA